MFKDFKSDPPIFKICTGVWVLGMTRIYWPWSSDATGQTNQTTMYDQMMG